MKKFLLALAITLALISPLLTGCGADTAATAAAEAKLKAEEAERARQQLEAAKKKIDEAQKEMQQRIDDAERDATTAAPPADAQSESKP
ncbi:MAG: hypothetical protein FWF41_04355 [Betaproteobacteria bacterium]|nr:hypothetical protein [Betaproteobacteria bacterium]